MKMKLVGLFLILSIVQLELVHGQDATPIFPDFISKQNKCCNTHNIYALDTSGSMYGVSWSKVLAFLAGASGSSDYTSLFTHGGTWKGPPFQVTNYLNHYLNAALPPALPLPYGDTDYDDALIRVIAILNQGYPEKTCITFFSDGWQQIYNKPVADIVNQFLKAKKNFQKKTGCPVCVKCYQTQPPSGWTNFDQFCSDIGATSKQLKVIREEDADDFIRASSVRGIAGTDLTSNGPRPDDVGGSNPN